MRAEDYDRETWFGNAETGCIYCAWGPDDTCLYVGQTENSVVRRITEHINQSAYWVEEFVRITSFEVPLSKLRATEKRMILKLQPTYNRTYLLSNYRYRGIEE